MDWGWGLSSLAVIQALQDTTFFFPSIVRDTLVVFVIV